MKLTNEQIQAILDGAPEGINLRHQNTNRNRTLNSAVCELSKIVNHHNPEVDVPIASGVWGCLDCVTSELEAPLLREILELRQEVERLKVERENMLRLIGTADSIIKLQEQLREQGDEL